MNKSSFAAIALLIAVGAGCRLFQTQPQQIIEPPRTAITKNELKERLRRKAVAIPQNESPVAETGIELKLQFADSNQSFLLNKDRVGSLDELLGKLKEIRRDREKDGVVKMDSKIVQMPILILGTPAVIEKYNSMGIYIEDLEKLADDLGREKFDQLQLVLAEIEPRKSVIEEIKNDELEDAAPVKTVSGGILNGKATKLAKPEYPAAARAVRATGAVNVQVTVDENGKVTAAKAVSGHPLLRDAAVRAAQESEFSPTLLGGKAVKVTGTVVFNFSE